VESDIHQAVSATLEATSSPMSTPDETDVEYRLASASALTFTGGRVWLRPDIAANCTKQTQPAVQFQPHRIDARAWRRSAA